MPSIRQLLLFVLAVHPLLAFAGEPTTSAAGAGAEPAKAVLDADLLSRLKNASRPPSLRGAGARPEPTRLRLDERLRELEGSAAAAAAEDPRLQRVYFPWLRARLDALKALKAQAEQALEAKRADAAEAVAAFEKAGEAFDAEFAAAAQAIEDDTFRPTVLVVSGGTSLGSYEAGLIHYYERFLEEKERYANEVGKKLSPPRRLAPSFSVVTGASAGALNSFLAALSACLAPSERPEDAKAFLWTKVGLRTLLREVEPNGCPKYAGGVLSRGKRLAEGGDPDGIQAHLDALEALWKDGTQWRDCDVRFGVSVARVVPRYVPVQRPDGASPESTVQLSRTTESFTFQMVRKGSGAPAFLLDEAPEWNEFHVEPGDRTGSASRQVDVGTVLELLKASSGIPLVFNPVNVPYTYGAAVAPGAPTVRVYEKNACFMDGGVFDNIPLSTAAGLARKAKLGAPSPKDPCRPCEPGTSTAPAPPPPFFLYIDPDNVAEPEPDAVEGSATEGRKKARKTPDPKVVALKNLGKVLGGVVNSARQAELLRTIQGDPETRARLRLPSRKHPVTGAMLGAFGAFTDRTFRLYDFFAGMADARVFLQERSLVFNSLGDSEREALVKSGLFRCFEQAWTNEAKLKELPACKRIIDAPTPPKRERDLTEEEQLSVLRLLEIARPKHAQDTFDDLDEFFAALQGKSESGIRFRFADLKYRGRRAAPGEGLKAVREAYERISVRLGDKMPAGVDATVRTVADAGLNAALLNRRVPLYGSIAMVDRGVDLSVGKRLTGPLDLVVGLRGAQMCLDCGDAVLTGNVVPYALLKVELKQTAVYQLQGGVGPLYRLAIGREVDGAFGFDVHAAAQLLQRVFLSADWNMQPWEPSGASKYDFTLGLGVRVW